MFLLLFCCHVLSIAAQSEQFRRDATNRVPTTLAASVVKVDRLPYVNRPKKKGYSFTMETSPFSSPLPSAVYNTSAAWDGVHDPHRQVARHPRGPRCHTRRGRQSVPANHCKCCNYR